MKNIKKLLFTIAISGVLITPLFVSAATIEELQAQIAVLLEQVAQFQQQLAQLQGTTTTAWCHDFNVNLKIGDSGPAVVELQTALNKEGFNIGNDSKGNFGQGTAAAVSGFQEKYKDEILTPLGLQYGTGFVGKATRAKLNQLYGCGVTPSITVLSPNGGEVWHPGETHRITWNSNSVNSVQIYIFDSNIFGSGSTNYITPNNTPILASAGYYDWVIPSISQLPSGGGNNYKITIRDTTQGANYDSSDAPFSIVAAGTPSYIILVTKSGTGSGTVTSNPTGVNCGTGCSSQSVSYTSGTSVTLTASASSGSTFASWSGDCSGTGTCTVSMSQARNVTATFNLSTTTPSITVLSPNGGEVWTIGQTKRVSWSAANVNYVRIYVVEDSGTITGSGVINYIYDGTIPASQGYYDWTIQQNQLPGGSTLPRNYKIRIDGVDTTTVGAEAKTQDFSDAPFSIVAAGTPSYILTVTKSGTGSGTITPSTGTLTWAGNTGTATYTSDTSVTLTASASSGSIFSGWSGEGCSGTGTTCTVSITQARNVTTTFNLSSLSAPTGLSYSSFSSSGNQVTLSWNSATDASYYSIRVDDITAGTNDNPCLGTSGDYCNETVYGTSTIVSITAGDTYRWWLHSRDSAGNWSASAMGPNFICPSCGPYSNQTVTGSLTGTPVYGSNPYSDDSDFNVAVVHAGLISAGQTATIKKTSVGYSYNFVGTTANGVTTEDYEAGWCGVTISLVSATQYTLTVTKSGAGSGTVTSNPTGVNCDTSCSSQSVSYTSGTSVTLTATPASGSTFASWSGEGCSGTGTCTVSMSQARNVTATFNLSPTTVQYILLVTKSGAGSGTVTSNPTGVNCGTSCPSQSVIFNSGTSVILTATPASGSTFAGWSGACSGTGTCTVTMSQARNVTATFNLSSTVTQYILLVIKYGTGSGTIISNPAGINCGSTCSASYTSGTSVTLTASASSGSTFAGWSSEGCSGTGTCTVSMTQARNVAATFNLSALPSCPVSYSDVVVIGRTSGTVYGSSPYSDDSGIAAAAVHAGLISVGQTATIKRTSTGYSYSFVGSTKNGVTTLSWTSGWCGVTLSIASTPPPSYIITVFKAGTGSGTVTSNPVGVNCGSSCPSQSVSYPFSTSVTLTATASSGSTFAGWSGDYSGTGTCTVSMTRARSVTATFNIVAGGGGLKDIENQLASVANAITQLMEGMKELMAR